ncbi:hypothetical protein TNCV_1566421 [Trichonephila clavipes]|nr:hypothetical protein TNCV_1566421 [Trichonephila clavipes]
MNSNIRSSPRNSSQLRVRFLRLSLALTLSITQVTVRFLSFSPNFEGAPGGGQGLPTSLFLPLTSRDDLRLFRASPCREGTKHLQTSMLLRDSNPCPRHRSQHH